MYNPKGKGISYGTSATTTSTEIKNGEEIDIVMIHGPAKYRLDNSKYGGKCTGCPHLFGALRRAKPKLHVFGHVHWGYGAEAVEWKGEKVDELLEDDNVDDGIKRIMQLRGVKSEGVRRVELGSEATTAFVNAAVMGDGGELENIPWLVELKLKRVD